MFELAKLKRPVWLALRVNQGIVTSVFAESSTVAVVVKLAKGLVQAKLPVSSRASVRALRRCVKSEPSRL